MRSPLVRKTWRWCCVIHTMKRLQFLSDLFFIIDMFNVEYRPNSGVLCSFVIVIFIMAAFLTGGGGGGGGVAAQYISNTEHRTNAAVAKTRELWCYHCNTMDSGERCEKLLDNRTDHHLKCREEKTCMVKSISLTTSTGNSTSTPKLWLLERNCTKSCEPGCIVIGERTKLYACTKCCEVDFCNAGKSAATLITSYLSVQVLTAIVSYKLGWKMGLVV